MMPLSKKSLSMPSDVFSWEKGFDRNYLLSHFHKCRRVDDGRVSFVGGEYHYWLPVINSAIRSMKMSRSAKTHCIARALNDPAIKLQNAENFLARCNLAYQQRLEEKPTDYLVYLSVTYNGPKLLNWISDDGMRLYWQPSQDSILIKKCRLARDELSGLVESSKIPLNASGLSDILVHVAAHDVREAQERAQRFVSKLLGVLNLLVNGNRSYSIMPFFEGRKPFNRIRLGPFQTIHLSGGALASKMIWYEENWAEQPNSVKFKGSAVETRKNIQGWWEKCRASPISQVIEDGLERYAEALDQSQSDNSLLRLWTALEQITLTQNVGYDETVRRIHRLSHGSLDATQVAHHIRLRRNSLVHASKSTSGDEAYTITTQVEWLVRATLHFLISEGKNFQSIEDYREFLELSGDANKLQRHAELIKYFLKLNETKQ